MSINSNKKNKNWFMKLWEQKSKEKKIIKAKSTPKSKSKLKTFDDYFQEYIKNKKIPKDTPAYLKKALERAMREYQV